MINFKKAFIPLRVCVFSKGQELKKGVTRKCTFDHGQSLTRLDWCWSSHHWLRRLCNRNPHRWVSLVFCPVKSIRWLWESTGQKNLKIHLCAVYKGVFGKGLAQYPIWRYHIPDEMQGQIYSKGQWGSPFDYCKTNHQIKFKCLTIWMENILKSLT